MTSDDGGWIGFLSDRHGRPSIAGNDHLSDAQRDELQRRGDERAQERGRHEAVIVVDVYETGEAVPYVQFPAESSVAPTDRTRISELVAKAADALRLWR